MANSKNIIIIVLVLIIVILGGWTYYTLTVTVPKEAEAACKVNIENEVIPQLKAAAEAECTNVVGQCQQALQQLMQVPVCAAALTQ